MAEFEKRLACVINADGTIARGYMIERCELQGENRYVITWKVALQGEAKTNFAGTIGSSLDEAVVCPLPRYQPVSQSPAALASPWADRSGA